MKLISDYLENAAKFAKMASEATDPKLRQSLEQQAVAYRDLAEKRVRELNLPPVNLPAVIPPVQKQS